MPVSIRPRAVLLGLLLGLSVCIATPYNNMYLQGTLLGGGHFPLAPFVLFFWLAVASAGANALVRRIGGRKGGRPPLLTGAELLTVWMLTVAASGLAYTGLARTFFVNLCAPFRQEAGSRWGELLLPLLPAQLYPQDPAAVRLLYNGLPRAADLSWPQVLAAIPWGSWAAPLAWWGAFIAASFGLMAGVVNLLSRQWIETERMNFPLLRLPQAMAEAVDGAGQDGGGLAALLGSRALLLGMAVPVTLHAVNGLSFYFPQVPQIGTLFLLGPYFPPAGVLSGFGKLKICFYPAFIGFAFLTSRQVSCGFWAFHLLGALLVGVIAAAGMSVPPAALGVTFGPTLAMPEETQMIGAYVAFFAFLAWLSRRHLAFVLGQAVSRAPAAPEAGEWLSVRSAFWATMLCLGVLAAWFVHFGLSPLMTALTLFFFLMMTVVAARVVCQGGIAYFTLTAAPLDGILAALGSGPFGGTGLLLAAVAQKVLYLDMRESLAPSLFHAAKVGERAGSRRLYAAGLALVVLLGAAAGLAAVLALGHKYGLRELNLDWETRTTTSVYENVLRLIEAPTGPNRHVLGFAALGAAIMAGLILCYHRFYWWPLHPIGYLGAYSSALRILWFSFLVGWLTNVLVLRYGGADVFRRARPFFFGLIIGDFLMGGLFAVIGAFAGASYMVLPD